MAKDDGQAFSMISIDIAELNGLSFDVLFTGFLPGAGTITHTFTTDGGNHNPETFVFNSSFSNVVAVQWTHPQMPDTLDTSQYDNIVLGNAAPVPEPATTLLLRSGLVGLVGLRRKLRKK